MAKREESAWARASWPWTLADDEPPFPTRGVPGGWLESWELADRLNEALWRADAEAEDRRILAVLVAERSAVLIEPDMLTPPELVSSSLRSGSNDRAAPPDSHRSDTHYEHECARAGNRRGRPLHSQPD
jgi:hypothetical protein